VPALIPLPATAGGFLREALIGILPLTIWLFLWLGRGGFWRVRPVRAAAAVPAGSARVVVVIPARDEAALLPRAITSLLHQTHPGVVQIIVVDDGSTDGTAAAARTAASACGALPRLTVLEGAPLASGWTGKLWAQSQGVDAARAWQPDYLLLTDADIEHAADSIATLVALAEREQRDLVSHMVRLSTITLAERLLIPAFVFFFFKLYPPAWVAAPGRTAAAAGGCILLRPQALERAGGLAAIRGRIIDDCALAQAVKSSGGQLQLQLAERTRSLRVYDSWAQIGSMISRTAFAQLHHSYLLLLVTLLGLGMTYLLPLALLFSGNALLAGCGLTTLILMSLCYLPMVRFYRLAPLWCVCLPLIATFYMAAVLHSAVRYALGRGGSWKGRSQDA
jgi:hopene-associated glycosyltransferase HpnB